MLVNIDIHGDGVCDGKYAMSTPWLTMPSPVQPDLK